MYREEKAGKILQCKGIYVFPFPVYGIENKWITSKTKKDTHPRM